MSKYAPQYYLDSHSHWRNKGIPILTVLCGSWNNTYKIWNQWIYNSRRITAVRPQNISRSLWTIWLEILLDDPNLQDQLLSFLAKICQSTKQKIHSELVRKSSYELSLFQQQLPVKISTQGVLLLQWFLDYISRSRKLTSELTSELAAVVKIEGDQDLAQGIMIFKEILPVDILPGLIVEITDDELSTSSSILTMLQVAEYSPEIPLAISIQHRIWENYYTENPESRISTMLRSGLIEVNPDHNNFFSLPHKIECIFHQYNASTQLVEEAKSLFNLIENKNEDKSITRGQAEQFLFHILELVPVTRGVFQLNVRMPFIFGNKPMEVNLFATNKQIVIEIDGYQHFRKTKDWQQDRRKDFLLQTHDILVLRFLAEDVVSKLDKILDVICYALEHRIQKNK